MSDVIYENLNLISNAGDNPAFKSGRTATVIWFNDLGRDHKIRKRILSFTQLPEGWHYGEGRSADECAIELALKVSSLFAHYGADEIEAFPDIEGGVLISGYRDRHVVEVFCDANDRLNLLHEMNDNILCEMENVSLEEVREFIQCLNWNRRKSSDFSILITIAEKNKNLRVLPLKTHRETGESLWSIPDAQRNTPEQNVCIYADTTIRAYPGIRSFFGE